MWERVVEYLMDYIENSGEQPLGPVRRIWWRLEFQTTRSNLPHIHCLTWTGENKKSEKIQHRIVCCEKHLLWFLLEDPSLKTMALVPSREEALQIVSEALRFHSHSCVASDMRCHKKTTENGESICRYPVYPHSEICSFKEVNVRHSMECLEVLLELDLAKKDPKYGEITVGEELKTNN